MGLLAARSAALWGSPCCRRSRQRRRTACSRRVGAGCRADRRLPGRVHRCGGSRARRDPRRARRRPTGRARAGAATRCRCPRRRSFDVLQGRRQRSGPAGSWGDSPWDCPPDKYYCWSVPEATLTSTKRGLLPNGEGWFVLNARESEWMHSERCGSVCASRYEPLLGVGVSLNVLQPGQPKGLYHAENSQEAFLVLAEVPARRRRRRTRPEAVRTAVPLDRARGRRRRHHAERAARRRQAVRRRLRRDRDSLPSRGTASDVAPVRPRSSALRARCGRRSASPTGATE